MAVIQKTLFAKNLDRYAVLVDDADPNSKYFKVTELPDTFTGGKNAFLVAGSKELVPDTKIQIELRDAAGNIIYHEPGEGYFSSSFKDNNDKPIITEYYEGVSKVVSVYVYPDTSYGQCTLTMLGELSEYTDGNGIVRPVPTEWENKYNVKWTKTINVNPSLANTTKIRFYQRPQAAITEILSPIYRIVSGSKVDSGTNQSFANIKLSRLETFAGDVKRVKVFRTSQGDISDYSLIQDILVESKELLTSYGLSGSVVGNTGIFTSETLKNYWNTGSLNAFLTSSRIESGVRLTGSGYFTYTSSLDIKSANTYELNLDAFYSSSTSSNLGVYLSWVSQSTTFSSSITTLVGTTPTKNLLDTVVPFKINKDYPSANLYFSQSQGEWHVGNISLKLSQDTAFSPDEISFVTTMPTIIGNETYNFKFEFYDVNNNYVPVAVTQSLNFTGGTIAGNADAIISASLSQSLDILYKVSSSISGTMTVYSSSASSSVAIVSGSVNTLSGSVSGTIGVLSGSISGTIANLSSSVSSSNVFILSSSLSKTQELANGQFSGSFIGSDVIYSPTIGGQQGYISSLFKVGTTPSIYLDARQSPRKIFIGGAIPSGDTEYSGAYNNSNTNVYLDSAGKFSLGNKLSYSAGVLSVTGQINIEAGGNAASTTDATNAVLSGSNAATNAATSASAVDAKVFTDSTGKLSKTPSATASGLYLGSTYLGYYNGTDWKTYMSDTGNFYLSGTGTNSLTWNGSALSINGSLTTSDATIGGWSIDATRIFATNGITLDSANKQITVFDAAGAGRIYINQNATLSSLSAGSTQLGYGLSSNDSGPISEGTYSKTSANTVTLTSGKTFNLKAVFTETNGTNGLTISSGQGTPISIDIWERVYIRKTAAPNTEYLIAEYKDGISFGTSVSLAAINNKQNSITIAGDGGTYEIITRVTWQAQGSYNGGVYTASTLRFSPFDFTAFPANSFVEIVAGGLQVGRDANNYVKIDRGAASGTMLEVGGDITATGNISAYYSDKRLKENIIQIDNPLLKLNKLKGIYYNQNKLAEQYGFTQHERQVGVLAQDVEDALPEAVSIAPFDNDGNGNSKSGERYLTVKYEKIVPLLIECIKQLQLEIKELKDNK